MTSPTQVVASAGGRQGALVDGSTRERILAAAGELFAARGFHATTVRDIAEAARVNIAAINYHFRAKEELYATVIETALMRWTAEIVQLDDLPPEAGLEHAVACVVSALIAPVFTQPANALVLRLLAWDMLERPDRRGHSSGGFTLALAQCLAPRLAASTTPDECLFLAHWLIGQCLLLSPALRSPHLAEQSPDGLVARITRLALQGWPGR
jgi:AcrR family transcriptional regulator